ncbi:MULTISPECIES: nicotinamide mononucleotide transporter [Arenibacter]|uniref:nicotinamide mononucleotide transporter n=1 Tax=Arenibacter TaxID=178469 RepID=UPI001C06AA46|nr:MULTISPECIES: nicotinamide mononucleotide transporter [Arenibacter]MBU2906432.1 nicotinamide mononucleotide transporter family protein [Arenibacter algicola]MCK0137138.1 nicotinamide mononucleotide transporter [Arenibacter sp. S6351L]
MEAFTKYYLLDWLAMILSLIAVYCLGKKNKSGFIYFAIANLIWISLGFGPIGSFGIGIGNSAFLIMNIRGFITWKHNKNEKFI